MNAGALAVATSMAFLFAITPDCSSTGSQSAPARPETWLDIKGHRQNPLNSDNGRITVLLFVMTDCPIANSYAPEISRTVAKYRDKPISFSMVYVDPDITSKSAQAHASEYGLRLNAILDPSRTLAKKAGATITPEAVILNRKNEIVYRGRIDNRVADFGKSRPRATRHDLWLTLDALLQGKKVPLHKTPAVGCAIPFNLLETDVTHRISRPLLHHPERGTGVPILQTRTGLAHPNSPIPFPKPTAS